jgi:Trk K+ transport system NAD-binding subunit
MIPFEENLIAKTVLYEFSVKHIISTIYSAYGEKAYNDLG